MKQLTIVEPIIHLQRGDIQTDETACGLISTPLKLIKPMMGYDPRDTECPRCKETAYYKIKMGR